MRLALDPTATLPLYRQIEAHLRQDIAEGRLPPGTRLPATRALARTLGLSRLTVEAAYAELQADGLIAGRVGSGTFVSLPPPGPPATDGAAHRPTWPAWQLALPRPLGEATVAPAPDVLRLDLGTADPRAFPVAELRAHLQRVLLRDGADALTYGDSAGHPPLRQAIARLLSAQGLPARPEHVLITAGSQRALGLVTTLLAQAGDTVLVEAPTYPGALDLFRARGLRVIGVPMDGQGLRVDALAPLLALHRPRFLYTIPNFHNPTGTCLPAARRRALVALAAEQGVPLVEDDFVGDLRFDGRAQPPLKALDPAGHVLYLGTFSKMLVPGLRLGFVLADGPVVARLAELHRCEDLAVSQPLQRALEAFVTIGRYRTHLARSVRQLRPRRDALVAAVRRFLPHDVACQVPQGGLFLWLRLPPGCPTDALRPAALAAGMSYAPGPSFFPDPADGRRHLRLCFAAHTPDELTEATRRLGRAIASVPGSGPSPPAESCPAPTTSEPPPTPSSKPSAPHR